MLQPLLSAAPSVITAADPSKSPVSTLHLHNTLLVALYANIQREPPSSDVASWVVATDKPITNTKSTGAGSGANDQAEERLKREVMTLHARDRKRIKALKENGKSVNDGLREIRDYSHELAVKPPSHSQNQADGATPQSATGTASTGTGATGLAKTNFGLEIRRRYAQPLACETLEFPSLTDMQNRIEPICYEEGLAGGVQQGTLQSCAELVEQAAEVFIKEMLGNLLEHSRSNPFGGSGVQTQKFQRQLRREDRDVERGTLQRNAADLLPVEVEMQAKREPLDMRDLRLSLSLADPFLLQDRFLAETILLNQWPNADSVERSKMPNGAAGAGGPVMNGVTYRQDAGAGGGSSADPDAMAVDDIDYATFKGVSKTDHDGLMGVLDDCLLAAG